MQSHHATIDVWALNATLVARPAKLELRFFDLASNWTHFESHDVTLLPNQSTELLSISCPCPSKKGLSPPSGDPFWTSSYSVVASARLMDVETGEVLARFANWPQPYRYLAIPDPSVKFDVDGEKVTINVIKPVKCLLLTVDGTGEEVQWSDNALDVTPGDPQVITAKGLNGRAVQIAYLGKEKASSV